MKFIKRCRIKSIERKSGIINPYFNVWVYLLDDDLHEQRVYYKESNDIGAECIEGRLYDMTLFSTEHGFEIESLLRIEEDGNVASDRDILISKHRNAINNLRQIK